MDGHKEINTGNGFETIRTVFVWKILAFFPTILHNIIR